MGSDLGLGEFLQSRTLLRWKGEKKSFQLKLNRASRILEEGVLTLECGPEAPGGLIKYKFLPPPPRASDSVLLDGV